IEHAIVSDNTFETVGVAENPVGHVAAVARPKRAFAVFIDKRKMLFGIVEALHQVFKWRAAPVAVDGIDEFLPVTRRAMEVNFDDNVAACREELGVPAIAP